MKGALAVLTAILVAALPGKAADGTWDGGGSQPWGQGIWGGVNNWSPNGVIADGTGSTATFGMAFANGYNVIVNTSRTIGHIVFNEPADANDLTLGKHVDDYILTLDVTNGAPTLPTINVTQANRTLTIFPRVGGADGVAKTGPGTLVLSNANLHTGPTTIQAGILTLGDSLAIQNSVLDTASSVRLDSAPTNTVNVTTTFSNGDSDLSVVTGNTLQFNAANWDTPQLVTLSAAEDTDWLNSQGLFTVSAPGTTSRVVTATEDDNDRAWLTNRPNFVIMCTDDQRWDAMGAVQRERGALARFPWFQSPNLDRLADGGVRFRNAFVVHALCSPSRATMLSGRYGHLNGVINNSTAFPTNSVTWATLLGAAGYVNGHIGKWHMGSQLARPGFHYTATYLDQGSYQNNNFYVNGVSSNIVGWVDDVSTDFATNFITLNRTNSFALFVGYKTAHNPMTPPTRLTNMFATNFAGPILNSNALPPWSTNTTYATEATMRDYHRCVYGVDENVGRILNLLDQLNLASNTVVMFLSDNGRYLGEHGQGDKRSAYDESLRIPFLLRYPARVGASNLNDSIVLNLDMAPTILEFAGLPVPASMQGRPIGPLLQGQTNGWRESFFYEYFEELGLVPNLYAIRTTTNKWITYVEHPEWSELFLMAEDPFETNNCAFNPAYASQRSTMESALLGQMDSLGLLARMQSPRRVGNTCQFDLAGGVGPVWQIETSTNLINWSPWSTVRMNVFTGNGAQVTVTDTNPPVPRRFYRGSIRSN